MRKEKINMHIEKGKDGYGAFAEVKGGLIATRADSYKELKENILEAVNLFYLEKEVLYTLDEIIFHYNMPSFFDFYKEVNATALAKRVGMSQSLLSQYATGHKKPSPKQVGRILEGIRSLGRELANLDLVV